MSFVASRPGELFAGDQDQREIIPNWTFAKTLLFMLREGVEPTGDEINLANAVLNSYMSHGETPASAIVPKIVADLGCSADSILVSGLSAALGKTHLGALEDCMKFLESHGKLAGEDLQCKIEDMVSKKQRIPGFGHRIHKTKSGDPRACELKSMLGRSGIDFQGGYLRTLLTIELTLANCKPGKFLSANIDGAAAAVLLALNLPHHVASLFVAIGRGADWYRIYMNRLNSFGGKHPRSRYMTMADFKSDLEQFDEDELMALQSAIDAILKR